jgi:hypothetical protein
VNLRVYIVCYVGQREKILTAAVKKKGNVSFVPVSVMETSASNARRLIGKIHRLDEMTDWLMDCALFAITSVLITDCVWSIF